MDARQIPEDWQEYGHKKMAGDLLPKVRGAPKMGSATPPPATPSENQWMKMDHGSN